MIVIMDHKLYCDAVILLAVLLTAPWTTIPAADSARILAVETVPGRSHWNFMSAVLRSLTDAGHHVTAFTPFPDGDRANYTEVVMSYADFRSILGNDIVELSTAHGQPFALMGALADLSRRFCDAVYADGRLNGIIGQGRDAGFDAVIVEPLAVDCASHLAGSLHSPLIYAIPSPMISYVERAYTGHASNPAYVAHTIARYAVPGTFVQRFANAVQLFYGTMMTSYRDMILKKTDPRPYDDAPTVYPSVIFQNSHYATEMAKPVPSNVIDVGGIHLKKAANSIPKDILEFIEDSPHGVIYFSFGSMAKMSSLPENIENTFKDAFAQVQQNVLWKYEGEMKYKPKNVMIKKWFPQRDILLHPKVKLFISHGGMSGVYETVDAGVPVLGFPIFYDQPRNLEHLVHAKIAISMDLLTITKEKLLNGILEMINNKKYLKNAKIASKNFKDRAMSPEQSVVYWTEYVIRHNGAPHLKSYSLNLSWYQYFLMDDIIVMTICFCLILCTSYTILKFSFNYIFKYLFIKI